MKKDMTITVDNEPIIPIDFNLGKHYQILKPIGSGAIGSCFLVTDTRNGSKKVVKIIRNHELWRALSENADLLTRIRHKNIVKTLKIETLNGFPCIVQEYVSGYSLELLALHHPITLGTCVQILEDILSALQYINNLGIAHKDIKPSNIIYDAKHNKATLVDLDYAVISSNNYKKFLGTIKYSAPEQTLQNYTSIKSDCYSLGLVLCYLITGKVPFSVDLNTRNDLVRQNLKNSLEANPAYPCPALEKLLTLIDSLLLYDFNKRMPIDDAVNLISEIKRMVLKLSGDIVLREEHNKEYAEPCSNASSLSLIERTVVGIITSIPPANPFSRNDVVGGGAEKEQAKEQFNDTYRSKLMQEYDNILWQAKISFGLWVASILICFALVIVAVCMIINGEYIQGFVTAVLDAFVVAIQKLFNVREDHYRTMVEQKIKHLEYGDYLDYAFEKANVFENPKDRNREAIALLKQIKETTKGG